MRGIFPAHFLSLLSKEYAPDLANTFDLIVGTSTGAIVAAAAATGLPLDRVVNLYEEHAPRIFSPRALSAAGKFRSAYSSEPLKALLTEIFTTTTMSAAKTRLVLPATDLSNGNVFVIKSPYLSSFVRDREMPLVMALMASCAAPSYFDPVKYGDYLLADGGLWGNNPSFIAYTEAIGKLGVAPDEVRLLSLGTGTGHRFYDIGKEPVSWGLVTGWGKELVDLFFNLQSRAAANSAFLLMGDRYHRVSFEETGTLTLDDVSQMRRLKSKAAEAFTYQAHDIKRFLDL